MKSFFRDLLHAAIFVAVAFGAFFLYILMVMK
jgi:hypothetical protein